MLQSSRLPVLPRAALLCLASTSLSFSLRAAQEAPVPAPEVPAEQPSAFRKALIEGRTWLDFRYRLESVDDDNFAKDGLASTLRTVLGYETSSYHGFGGLIEFEDVAPIGNDKLYNSGTNGAITRPSVPDTDDTEINQLFASYTYEDDSVIRVGRQEIAVGNHRIIGIAPWRQNHQSFDSVRWIHRGLPNTTIDYSFLHNANRPSGEASPTGDERMRSHALNVRHELGKAGALNGYAFLLDFDQLKQFSSLTYGVRFAGESTFDEDFALLYTAEYAQQQDAGNSTAPTGIDADYYVSEVGVRFAGVTLKLGTELLGGSGNPGDKFSTPLASRHRFNGFADLFVDTPDAGLLDRSIGLWSQLHGVQLGAVYHDFDADAGTQDYGTELDLVANYKVGKRLGLNLKYANFNRDGNAPVGFADTRRIMAWVTYSLL